MLNQIEIGSDEPNAHDTIEKLLYQQQINQERIRRLNNLLVEAGVNIKNLTDTLIGLIEQGKITTKDIQEVTNGNTNI